MAKTVLHLADTRGMADQGWLKSHHSFSFSHYYNPDRMAFGALRVLNDDTVAGGQGFGMHAHDNMEIISIPLEGALEHQDNMGNTTVILAGDVQVMSAGTGVYHSEYNKNKDVAVKFLQIWLYPKVKNVKPRYHQITLDTSGSQNRLQQILSPDANDEGVWVHQDAWFYLGNLTQGFNTTYQLKKEGNGVYIFVLKGDVSVDGQALHTRDGYGIWETEAFTIEAKADAQVLVMEVPMKLA